MHTLGQKRAAFALEKIIENIGHKDEKFKNEFKSFASGVPSMILMNGFGQALAFIKTKKDEKYKIVFNIVKEWLRKENFVVSLDDDRSFIMEISKMDQKKYLDAQKETLAILEWIKRYAAMEAVEA